jgi:hypothetical protein
MIAKVKNVFIWDRGWREQPRVELQPLNPVGALTHYACEEFDRSFEFFKNLIGETIKIENYYYIEIIKEKKR